MSAKRNRLTILVSIMTALHASLAGAQADIVGDWEQPGAGLGGGAGGSLYYEEAQDRGPGPDLGDYAGLPITAAARFKAQTYSPEWLTVPEHQCIAHPSVYQLRSPGHLTIAKEYDLQTWRVVAYRTTGNFGLIRTIWMDGRSHPSPIARHTWEGFSTGRWIGDKLAVQTTHIKAGWVRRNGVVTSDRARMSEYYVRHGDFMTVVEAVEDPLYLEEPLVRSTDFRINPRPTTRMSEFGGFINGGTGPIFFRCEAIEELERDPTIIPSILPGQNRDLVEAFAINYKLPLEAAFGGRATIYPEFQIRLRNRDFANLEPPPATRNAQRQANDRATAAPPTPAGTAAELLSQHVAGKVWMISVGGRNTVVQIGDDGIFVVDPGSAENAERVLTEIQRLAKEHGIRHGVRVIVNTSADLNRIAANRVVATAPAPNSWVPNQRANVIGHANVALHLGRERIDLAPVDLIFKNVRSMYFNREAIQIIPVMGGHSDSDVIVHFRQSDVIVTGNVLHPETYPVFATGGSLQGTLDTLNRLVAMTVAEWRSQGGTMVVPATGRLYDQGDLAEYRDMVTIVRDRLNHGLQTGMNPAQVRAANYTRDYDVRYGSRPGAGSTDEFLDVALRDLVAGSAGSRTTRTSDRGQIRE